MNQNNLRQQVKLTKALNDDFSYKDFAEALNITDHSFYNWLNGYYNLSYQKYIYLKGILDDLIEIQI